jgi:hypothetical protein
MTREPYSALIRQWIEDGGMKAVNRDHEALKG